MKCVKCGLPIDEATRCSCEPEVCYHCCSCEPGCECGCIDKEDNNSAAEEILEE
jgi:hypothetical protein